MTVRELVTALLNIDNPTAEIIVMVDCIPPLCISNVEASEVDPLIVYIGAE